MSSAWTATVVGPMKISMRCEDHGMDLSTGPKGSAPFADWIFYWGLFSRVRSYSTVSQTRCKVRDRTLDPGPWPKRPLLGCFASALEYP